MRIGKVIDDFYPTKKIGIIDCECSVSDTNFVIDKKINELRYRYYGVRLK